MKNSVYRDNSSTVTYPPLRLDMMVKETMKEVEEGLGGGDHLVLAHQHHQHHAPASQPPHLHNSNLIL